MARSSTNCESAAQADSAPHATAATRRIGRSAARRGTYRAAAMVGLLLALPWGSAAWAQDAPTPQFGDEAGVDPVLQDPEPPSDDGAADVPADTVPEENAPGLPLVASAGSPFGFLVADSELVYGPSLYAFDTVAFADARGGYLSTVYESLGAERLRGPEIVQRIAEEYSVGPRVLLTLLELNSGWVTVATPAERSAPLGGDAVGLAASLAAAADTLAASYYASKLDRATEFPLADGALASLTDVNAGTFAVMAWLGARTAPEAWAGLEMPSRFVIVWHRLFGDALAFDNSAKRPARSPGPALQSPIPSAELWYYIRGPHGPVGHGAPWAAVDFAPPPPEATGCAPSPSWVTSVANGTVVVSRAGNLVVDLDDDRFSGSGWAHVYRHLWSGELPPVGRFVRVGDRLGHPSCDGGATAPARVSLSRTYDGEWIAASDPISPLALGGWIVGAGSREGTGPLVGPGFSPRQPGPAKQPAVNGVFTGP